METQIVVQIIFEAGTDESEILEAVRALGQSVAVETESIKEFDPAHGGPVIYFP